MAGRRKGACFLGAFILSAGAVWGSQAAAEPSACQSIRQACRAAGFTPGGAREGLGLANDCFSPIVDGATARGSTRSLPNVDPTIVAACRASTRTDGPKPFASDEQPSADQGTATPGLVYDSRLNVTWLADGDLAASERFGVATINRDGSMTYADAVHWVAAMNMVKYLGHDDWQLPTSPNTDRGCSAKGPQGNSFGYGCEDGALGSLFYRTLGVAAHQAAASAPQHANGPFRDIQPHYYWSGTHAGTSPGGYSAFSFGTGVQDGINYVDNLHVLPMIQGHVEAPGTVYDAAAGVTWIADGNLAAKQSFGVSGIWPSGAMSEPTAESWIAAMNATDHHRGYLGQTGWALPPAVFPDNTCSFHEKAGVGCKASPMGQLYYHLLGLSAGDSVMAPVKGGVGQFYDIQPYAYWTCTGDAPTSPCGAPPTPGFQWDFDFVNGFLNTDITQNIFYVMVYFPGRPASTPPHPPAPHGGCGSGTNPKCQ